jgi:acyl carrier protein
MNQRIIHILEELFGRGEAFRLGPADSLLDNGVVDSLGILELVKRLEAEFHIQVEADELSPDNLDSVELIADYLRRKGVAG